MARSPHRVETAPSIPGLARYRLVTVASVIGAFVLGIALASSLLILWPDALRQPVSASASAMAGAGALVGMTVLVLLAIWLLLDGWISGFAQQANRQIARLARKRQRQLSLQKELRSAGPYIEVMNRQLKAILAQSEFGVVALIGRLQAVVDATRCEVEETFSSLHEGLRMHEQLRHRMEALLEELQEGPHRLADAEPAAGRGVLNFVIAELTDMDVRFRNSSEALFGVMKSINSNSQAVRVELSDALERIQHHDVTQQRLRQVELALQDMCDHLRGLTELLDDPGWDGAINHPLQARLDQHAEAYVMESQRQAHAVVAGLPIQDAEAPAVELF